jgi:hypothetical protein
LEDIDMAENPLDGAKDPTRAEDIVLNLGDKFAATATAKSVYGEPVRVDNPAARLPVTAFPDRCRR